VLLRSRRRARAALSPRPGVFAGFSPSAEPRVYDGSFDYDWGFAAIENGCLVYRGDRCTWHLQRSDIERIWLTPGPFNWMPRPAVCIALKSGAAFTLRAFDGAFGPAAHRAAARLLRQVREWQTADSASANSASADSSYGFASVKGAPSPPYSWHSLLAAFPRYGVAAIMIECFVQLAISKTGLPEPGPLLGCFASTFALAVFMGYPAVRRARFTVQAARPAVPLRG